MAAILHASFSRAMVIACYLGLSRWKSPAETGGGWDISANKGNSLLRFLLVGAAQSRNTASRNGAVSISI
jgi:hypothetical protein